MKNTTLLPEERLKLLAIGRLDPNYLDNGLVKLKYRATEPVWKEKNTEGKYLIPLRDHMKSVCSVAQKFAEMDEEWTVVSENLRLAASVNDIFADTDLQGDSFLCGPAADYEDANSEISAKYLAGYTIFSMAWTAYEGLIDIIKIHFDIKKQRGPLGREIALLMPANNYFPFLRLILYEAIATRTPQDKFFKLPEVKRILQAGSLLGLGAEHLAKFRNALIHGDVLKPDPLDWGEGSKYNANKDPALTQFHYNTRLLLITIQVFMSIEQNHPEDIYWLISDEYESLSAVDFIRNLHATKIQEEDNNLFGLD